MKKPLKLTEIYVLMNDLKGLFDIYADLNARECGRIAIKKYIRLITLLIEIESSDDRKIKYHDHLENAYRIAGGAILKR